jgi:hypothetical protein
MVWREAIANATLKLFLGEDAQAHLGNMAQYSLEQWQDPDHFCSWVQHAYFGARIDLVKQGNHTGVLYEYDIASAYPAIACEIPTMKDGVWELVENPTREQVFASSPQSMLEVKTHNYGGDLPFYALPYGTHTGSIMFPAERLIGGRIYRNTPEIEIVRGWIFKPASDFKPLGFARGMFDYSTALIKVDKKDSRGQVIKLNINAIYGKMAHA